MFLGMLEVFVKYLFCLKEMGVDIFWFMFVYFIFEAWCKGSLGSYYVVVDYMVVNFVFGIMEEFKVLVKIIYDMDMWVVLDWVFNYIGWDYFWIIEYFEYYIQDSMGNVIDFVDLKIGEFWGWIDVVDLNYDNVVF